MLAQYGGEAPPATFAPGLSAPACARASHDAIVVLGCPTYADGGAAPCQIARADIAVAAARAGLGERFITTGAAVATPFVEAETLRTLLRDRGVADEKIVVEPKAEHTDENLYFSSRLMQERGWKTALVVSEDPRHLVMTAICDANCCVELGRLTVFQFDDRKLGHYVLYDAPSADAPRVTEDECNAIRPKLMCLNEGDRRACARRFMLTP
jgi:hypothetical protein